MTSNDHQDTPRAISFGYQSPILLTIATILIGISQYLSVTLSELNTSFPAIWFTSGVAAGFCFLLGRQTVYATFIGSLAAQLLVQTELGKSTHLAFSLFLSFCLTLQTITIYLSFKQARNHEKPFRSANNLLALLGIFVGASAVTSLLINMNHSVFVIQSSLDLDSLLSTFLTNFSGLLCIAPFVIAFQASPLIKQRSPKNRFNHVKKSVQDAVHLEHIAWFILALTQAYAIILFGQDSFIFAVPMLMWAATRFLLFHCTAAIAICSLFVMTAFEPHTLSANSSPTSAVAANFNLTAWVFENLRQVIWLLIVATTLYFNTLLSDRRKIETKLEDMVLQRTQDLHNANQELKDEVFVRQQAEKSFRTSSKRYRALIETTGIPIIVLDHKFCIRQWNNAAENLFGYSREEILGKNYIDVFVPQPSQDETAWRFTKVLESGVSKENMESEALSHDGISHTMLWNMNLLVDGDDERQGQLLLIGQNISEIRQTQDQLRYLAHFDALTGTANRRLFEDRCEQAIQSALRHKHHIALIALDVDHFKRINDTLGHDIGDELLVTLSNRLKNCVRREDTIARLGGDEFAVLLANISGREGAETVARNILEAITNPIQIKSSELVITSSIGITLCPADGTHYPDLLKNADMAMYRAKKAGRNNIQFYSPEMNEEMQKQLQIEQELRTALQQRQFQLFYQPIIDIETGIVVALEALLRWQHPQKGLLKPDYFLHVAEQTGQLHEIGKWALKQACTEGKAIQEWSNNPLQIALNLSSRQYSHPGLVKMVDEVLQETRFNPHNLILEMSEATITNNLDSSFTTLNKLSQLGVALTIDSFGTGLSSLRQLKQIPIDIIKIDRTFVNGIPEDENDMAITETLLAIASQMDLKTFATGIENKEQEAFLKINGCRYAQGYHYSRPIPFGNLPSLFENISAGKVLSEAEQIFLPLQQKRDDNQEESNFPLQ